MRKVSYFYAANIKDSSGAIVGSPDGCFDSPEINSGNFDSIRAQLVEAITEEVKILGRWRDSFSIAIVSLNRL